MLPIELIGWILSIILMISFIASLVFLSKKPVFFSESEYKAAQKNHQNFAGKSKRFQ